MTLWSKDSVVDYIEYYRSFECLWKIKSKDYSINIKREHAYEELIQFSRRFHENANKDFVIKKISYLRTTFRKELKKLEMSKLSEAGSDEIYEPKL